MKLIEREVVTALRRHGYKLTPQRRLVIQTVVSTQNHLTPIALYERVHQVYPNIGLVTIYRTLEILAKLKLICEVHSGGSCGSYLLKRPLEHHHHLICSECGAVVDFTGCDLSQLEQRLSLETGFEINDHLLEFIGLCQACQKEAT
jgi:Fur family ferric uptake transcriptional regulator